MFLLQIRHCGWRLLRLRQPFFFFWAYENLPSFPHTGNPSWGLYEVVANMVRDNVGQDGRRYFPLFLPYLCLCCLAIFWAWSHWVLPSQVTYLTFALTAYFCWRDTNWDFRRWNFYLCFFPWCAPMDSGYFNSYWTGILFIASHQFSGASFCQYDRRTCYLKVIAGFVIALGVAGIVPLAGLVAITALEFMVAVIQAYVFAILTCIYLHDACICIKAYHLKILAEHHRTHLKTHHT